MTPGQAVASDGTVTFLVGGVGPCDLAYSATATLEAIETVSVPYGTFTAIRGLTTLTITGLAAGAPCTAPRTQTPWLADHVGLVKRQEPSDPPIPMASTNVTPPSIALASAVLPGSHAVSVGSTTTAFATILAAGTITAAADTGSAVLPLALALCQTDALGACANPLLAAAQAVVDVDPGETLTFSVLATASGAIALDAAARRITVRFTAGGVESGSTGVAVRTVP